MRAVFDPNVLISALLAPAGAPAELITRWFAGEFELVVSPSLIEELERAPAYPKICQRLPAEDAAAFVALIRDTAEAVPDAVTAPRRSPDPGDDYLVALAERSGALLVSGDRHLSNLETTFPIRTPRAFLDMLNE